MLIVGEGSLALAAIVVMGIGSSAIGAIGTLGELAVKEIDKNRHPFLRTIGEVFAKIIQSTSAAYALLLIGSLFTNRNGAFAVYGVGTALILTPIINSFLQQTNQTTLKKTANSAEHIVSIVSKTINTSILTAAVFMALGIPAAVIAGVGLSALSIITYQKK